MTWQFGRAPRGGLIDPLNEHPYKGGEFLPFYVPRPLMPQINEEDYTDFLIFLNELLIGVKSAVFMPEELHAHQRIDPIKASRMTPEVRAKPIWISTDHYVLDGNHRWLAHAMDHTWINCWQIELPFAEAIDAMFSFPRTFALRTHEETN